MEIYLDNAATTKPWPEVVEAVGHVLTADYGNTSSLHGRGLGAMRLVREASETITQCVGSGQWKVIFTSGGTEADVLAVFGSVPKGKRDEIVITSVEHAAIEESSRQIEFRGGRCTVVSAGRSGVVSAREIVEATNERTGLVSINHVANEMGTVQPVAQIARMVKQLYPRCRVHVDAVQALAQLDLLNYPAEVDTVAISSHKIHGTQGVGALLVRPNVVLRPMFFGGDQQDSVRPGTLNLPGIVGFGVAAGLVERRRVDGVSKMKTLSDDFVSELCARVAGVRLLGDTSARAPGIVIIAVDGVRSEVLLRVLEKNGVYASAGSACHASRSEPPSSLRDAGLKDGEGPIRLSLSYDTTKKDMRDAVSALSEGIADIRGGHTSKK